MKLTSREDKKLKGVVLRKSLRLGTAVVVQRLVRFGVSMRMARYLVAGSYKSRISENKRDQIVRAMK